MSLIISDNNLWNRIKLEYSLDLLPIFVEALPNGNRAVINNLYLMYEFSNGFAIFKLAARDQYKLLEILGEITKEELLSVNLDKDHRMWISKTFNTTTPRLAYDELPKQDNPPSRTKASGSIVEKILHWTGFLD